MEETYKFLAFGGSRSTNRECSFRRDGWVVRLGSGSNARTKTVPLTLPKMLLFSFRKMAVFLPEYGLRSRQNVDELINGSVSHVEAKAVIQVASS